MSRKKSKNIPCCQMNIIDIGKPAYSPNEKGLDAFLNFISKIDLNEFRDYVKDNMINLLNVFRIKNENNAKHGWDKVIATKFIENLRDVEIKPGVYYLSHIFADDNSIDSSKNIFSNLIRDFTKMKYESELELIKLLNTKEEFYKNIPYYRADISSTTGYIISDTVINYVRSCFDIIFDEYQPSIDEFLDDMKSVDILIQYIHDCSNLNLIRNGERNVARRIIEDLDKNGLPVNEISILNNKLVIKIWQRVPYKVVVEFENKFIVNVGQMNSLKTFDDYDRMIEFSVDQMKSYIKSYESQVYKSSFDINKHRVR